MSDYEYVLYRTRTSMRSHTHCHIPNNARYSLPNVANVTMVTIGAYYGGTSFSDTDRVMVISLSI